MADTWQIENAIISLTEQERSLFDFKYLHRRKKVFIAYLWFFFCFAAHFFYLDPRRGWIWWIVFQITLGGFLIWGVIEVFYIPMRVKNTNIRITHEIIQEIKRRRTSRNTNIQQRPPDDPSIFNKSIYRR